MVTGKGDAVMDVSGSIVDQQEKRRYIVTLFGDNETLYYFVNMDIEEREKVRALHRVYRSVSGAYDVEDDLMYT
jgi:hypothetical protein